jgi:lipoprotein-anchoring transpeptidase ErfK/SrfK/Zn-dependent peptidase ImmA (M78 family)
VTHAMLQKPTAKQTPSNVIQRKCSCGKFSEAEELCENCQRKTRGDSSLSNYASAMAFGVVPNTSGSPLDAATRAFMERGFQADFSSVRIHTGVESSRQAEEQGARAYTSGQHIVFGEAQYNPHTAAGRELIAHELTHTIQQGKGRVTAHSSSQSLERFETEADNAARRVSAGKRASEQFSAAPRGAIQRLAISNAELDEELDTEARDGDSPVGGLRPVPSHSELVARATRDDEPMVIQQAPRRSPIRKTKASPKKNRLSPVPKSLSGTTISHIDIDLSSQRLTVRHADGSELGPIKISSGKGKATAKGDPCANQSETNCTPTGTFKPSALGDAGTTNKKGAHMSWFVKFDGDAGDRGIGIHNSQPVTGRPASHGCIRVNERTARYINEHVTRETEINVHGKAPTSRPNKRGSKLSPKIQRMPKDGAAQSTVPPIVHEVLRQPGKPLDAASREFFEPRFGRSFSDVRIHDDAHAAASADAIGARAYTYGHNIVLGAHLSHSGEVKDRGVLAHELVHVTQHSRATISTRAEQVGVAHSAAETEADSLAERIMKARSEVQASRTSSHIQRLLPLHHDIADTAAFRAAQFSESQIEMIHEGNLERDLSQFDKYRELTSLATCKFDDVSVVNTGEICPELRPYFGGYNPAEHFDGYIRNGSDWSPKKDQTSETDSSSRAEKTGGNRQSPIEYIREQLGALANTSKPLNERWKHLGNVAHTIQDFFAHSNFVELAHGDKSFGKAIHTGTYSEETDSGHSQEGFICELVGPRIGKLFVDEDVTPKLSNGKARSERTFTHSEMAKDSACHPRLEEARRLGAYVTYVVGTDVRNILGSKADFDTKDKIPLSQIADKLQSKYLTSPSADRWWDETAKRYDREGWGKIDSLIKEASKTKKTHHLFCNPLRSLARVIFEVFKQNCALATLNKKVASAAKLVARATRMLFDVLRSPLGKLVRKIWNIFTRPGQPTL